MLRVSIICRGAHVYYGVRPLNNEAHGKITLRSRWYYC